MMKVDSDFFDALRAEKMQGVFQNRLVENGEQRFREFVCQGLESASKTSRENQRFHFWLVSALRDFLKGARAIPFSVMIAVTR